jgi:hypothetical protein
MTSTTDQELVKILAQDVLAMAYAAEMPDSYWKTDRRILRACEVLGMEPGDAQILVARAFEELDDA